MDSKQIVFSFLLVIRNEEKYINDLLLRVLNQDFPEEKYEIIVINGDSTDSTEQVVRKIMDEHPNRISYYENPKGILPTGWNIGITNSSGKYIIRVDGHTQIPTDFLTKYYDLIQRKPEMACVGGVIKTKGVGFWGEIIAHVYSHPFGVGNSLFRITKDKWEGEVDTVPYGAYKREIFKEVGLFNERLNRSEDLDMHARIRKAGGKFFLSSSIVSTYFSRSTLKAFTKKALADGKWTMIASSGTKGLFRFRHLVPIIVFMMGIMFTLGSFFSPLILKSFILLLAIYFTLIGIGSVSMVKKRKNIAYFFPTFLVFFLLHFIRGYGLLSGLTSKQYWKVKIGYEKRQKATSNNVL
ncbi:glycosyltransferase family 2 protein [Metabacillus rhizolycopersici]|uniref:Glycosyltransferase family 2 protein n=1 Tax=Metabacillus rhizolycopersici TaxID=2875709 RepID=A0ABS7UMB7_9BACI|nr:glycosyltransferase family 2 protein [Metabacillus rhizolycopersici]MBZ5749080.1 glycosyltransferase family 2 protein [Metabacillus rhizolycopersici]